jgi:hypothetical protein
MNFAQLEKNNALILEIMQMEIPDTEATDKFADKFTSFWDIKVTLGLYLATFLASDYF